MLWTFRFALSVFVVLAVSAVGTAAENLAGTWRMTIPPGGGRSLALVLVAFEKRGDQWAGKFLGATSETPIGTSVENVRVSGDRLQFTIKMEDQEHTFDGKIPPSGRKISGTFLVQGALVLTVLEPSRLTTFDRFELLKEVVALGEAGPAYFEAAAEVLLLASVRKAKVEEVRAWADQAVTAAAAYGQRWQQAVALRTAQMIASHKEYAAIALDQARRAEQLLGPTEPPDTRLIVLETLAHLLRKNGETADLPRVTELIDAAERRDYEEYQRHFPFKPDPYAGRPTQSDRVVLVELFAGADCPPSVAGILAFDGLARAYKPTEVLRLQYHVNIPFTDPMTNPATLARQKYYGVRGTPAAFVNGKAYDDVGGPARSAIKNFSDFRRLIDPPLTLPATAKLTLTASRDGDKVTFRAKVGGLAKPGERLRLRLFLAEPMVRHRGANGIRYHHAVVRAAVGLEGGFPLRQASVEHAADVNLGDLRKALVADLTKFQQEPGNEELPNADRLLVLTDLFVVALVQDDVTREVLQAAQIGVPVR